MGGDKKNVGTKFSPKLGDFSLPLLIFVRVGLSWGQGGTWDPDIPIDCQILCSLSNPFSRRLQVVGTHQKNQAQLMAQLVKLRSQAVPEPASSPGGQGDQFSPSDFIQFEASIHLENNPFQGQGSTLPGNLHIHLTLPLASPRGQRNQRAWASAHLSGTP